MNNKEVIPLRCKIHHIATDIRNRLPYNHNFWMKLGEPVFPEQKQLLEELFSQQTWEVQDDDDDEM